MYLGNEVVVYLSNCTDKEGGDSDFTDGGHTRLLEKGDDQTGHTVHTVIFNTELVLTSLKGYRGMKGREGKEEREGREGKEEKEGREGKERKEGREGKEGKEGREGKKE